MGHINRIQNYCNKTQDRICQNFKRVELKFFLAIYWEVYEFENECRSIPSFSASFMTICRLSVSIAINEKIVCLQWLLIRSFSVETDAR
ncbi:hypothetical protein C0J52_04488 [Blattella germanica]|nr:hypothetical protein C0J52_04488 [Blattella germanica]